MFVLIPAYRPDERLVHIVDGLRLADPTLSLVVVDDGSGPAYRHVFDTLGSRVTVLRHGANRGKGAALRTGFAHVLSLGSTRDVVTADADGQHRVPDILRIVDRLRVGGAHSRALILGSRTFTGAHVPLRSRLGNRVSRALFRMVSRRDIGDTQTGLRGIPAAALPVVAAETGDRFDYELRMLLNAGRRGFDIEEVPIETVYLDDNASSHFRPVVDSLQVLRPVLLFAASSLLAFTIDLLALWLLVQATGSLLAAVIGARLLSASVNFAVNRALVFRRAGAEPPSRGWRGAVREALRYGALATVLLATNYAYLETLTTHGVPLLLAKVLTETVLFAISFLVQKRVVFSPSTARSSARGAVPPPLPETAAVPAPGS